MSSTAKSTVLAASLALSTTLAGCNSQEQRTKESNKLKDRIETTSRKTAMHEALQNFQDHGWHFLKADGGEEDLTKVQKWIGNNNSSISFMLSACQGAICPTVAANLATLNKRDPNMKHLIISTDPMHDQMADMLRGVLVGGGIDPKNFYILYPASAQTLNPNEKPKSALKRLEEGAAIAAKIQQGMGLPTEGENPPPWKHNSFVQFYSSQGKKISEADGNFKEELNAAFETLQSSTKGIQR